MAATPGSVSSRASRRWAWATTTLRATSSSPDVRSPRLPHSPSTPPIRVRSTWRRAQLFRTPPTAAPPGGSRPTCRVPRAEIWIDPRSPKGDRTLYAAGPDALYIRREGKWRTTPLPGTVHGNRRHTPSLLCHHRRQDPCLHGQWRHLARFRPSRISRRSHGHRRQPGPSRDCIRVLQRIARTRPPDLGRRQDHRCGPPLGTGLRHRARRLADRPFRRRLGRQPVRPRCGAARRQPRLRHRLGPRAAHHRRRQELESDLLLSQTRWQLDHQRHRRHHLLWRPLRPLRSAPHVHQLHGYRTLGQRYGGRQLVQRHTHRRSASVGEHHLLDGVRSRRARPHVGRHERDARPAASQDVAPRIARFLHRRRAAQRRWRTHLACADQRHAADRRHPHSARSRRARSM